MDSEQVTEAEREAEAEAERVAEGAACLSREAAPGLALMSSVVTDYTMSFTCMDDNLVHALRHGEADTDRIAKGRGAKVDLRFNVPRHVAVFSPRSVIPSRVPTHLNPFGHD